MSNPLMVPMTAEERALTLKALSHLHTYSTDADEKADMFALWQRLDEISDDPQGDIDKLEVSSGRGDRPAPALVLQWTGVSRFVLVPGGPGIKLQSQMNSPMM